VGIRLRCATPADIDGIAGLHTDSWRRNYRGAFADSFLDGDLLTERRTAWTARLTHPGPLDHTLVADPGDGAIVGFAHTVFDRHSTWGAVLDNLHVRHGLKGQGIGRRLVTATAEAVGAHDPVSGMYVEVLDLNTPAQAFYKRLGAHHVHTGPANLPAAARRPNASTPGPPPSPSPPEPSLRGG
jgi:ribosomal protein S18 acetylase RimI-like enzyme